MSDEIFTGSFTQQEPIPDEAIAAAVAVMKSGRLHRYNVVEGVPSETALLEQEFAARMGVKYCLAVASGGYALGCALRAMQIAPNEPILTNAFTLAPVPGAIVAAGGRPVFVEVSQDLVIDLQHLKEQIRASGATILMLSHMRGHICDMDALMQICDDEGVRVIEDCAHTMGAAWNGVPSGRHGLIACYSTQTYKHMNSGEGGFLITDDADLMARAVILSGSYMLYDRHLAVPGADVFEDKKLTTPNVSGRMDNLRAAILRPQLALLEQNTKRWNDLYAVLVDGLSGLNGLVLPHRAKKEQFVASSFQFLLPDWSPALVRHLVSRCAARGVELKWFGAQHPLGFTSRYDSWRYAQPPKLPQTDKILAGLVDMRIPLTFTIDDCAQIARIIRAEFSSLSTLPPA